MHMKHVTVSIPLVHIRWVWLTFYLYIRRCVESHYERHTFVPGAGCSSAFCVGRCTWLIPILYSFTWYRFSFTFAGDNTSPAYRSTAFQRSSVSHIGGEKWIKTVRRARRNGTMCAGICSSHTFATHKTSCSVKSVFTSRFINEH